MQHSILFVDDEQNILNSLVRLLRNEDYKVLTALSGTEGLKVIEENDISLVVSDYMMPGMTGVDFLIKVKEMSPDTIRIMLTGRADLEATINAINKGEVYRFINKPWDDDELLLMIKQSLENRDLALNLIDPGKTVNKQTEPVFEGVEGVVGKSAKMLEIYNYIRRVAPYYRSIVITGETGTGKEVLAKTLHAQSPAAKNPFVPCNCASLVGTLIESELFGYKKGAFTGAVTDKVGLFEAAAEGTIFLDEIGDIPASFQPRLLRVLQDGEFRPVGSTKPLKAKCRVIAATNKNLSTEVKEGRFREDLFFRLTPLSIRVPSLRERKEEIPPLVMHIIKKFSKETGKSITGISRPAMTFLMSYDWPGNVRELENIIEQAAILTTKPTIDTDTLPVSFQRSEGTEGHQGQGANLNVSIRSHIEEVLRKCDGNRTHAAKNLGISRRSLLRRIEKYGIE